MKPSLLSHLSLHPHPESEFLGVVNYWTISSCPKFFIWHFLVGLLLFSTLLYHNTLVTSRKVPSSSVDSPSLWLLSKLFKGNLKPYTSTRKWNQPRQTHVITTSLTKRYPSITLIGIKYLVLRLRVPSMNILSSGFTVLTLGPRDKTYGRWMSNDEMIHSHTWLLRLCRHRDKTKRDSTLDNWSMNWSNWETKE